LVQTLVSASRGGAAAAAPSPTPTATAAKRRIGFRIHQEPIQEQIDRLGHHLDRIECSIVEGVIGALNKCQRRRRAEGVELRKKVDARLASRKPIVAKS
jgi:hypothetical protein